MRKNILIATLVGLCVVGMTACSRGEENKPADSTTPTTAMTQEQAPAADQNQAVPAPSAENNVSDASAQAQPAQAEVNQVAMTPDAQTTAPVVNPETQTQSTTTTTTTTGTDSQGQPAQTSESSTSTTTAPATDSGMSSMAPSTTEQK